MGNITNREFWDFRVKTRAQFTKLAEQIANIDTSGGGGISELTSQMVVDALGYTPYNATNPAKYITETALTPYAKTDDVNNTIAGLSSVYLGKNATATDSAKLGGTDASEYAKNSDIPSLDGYAKTEDIPTTVSELTDSGDYLKKTLAEATYAKITTVQGYDNRIGGLEGAVPQLSTRLTTVEGVVATLSEDITKVDENLSSLENTLREEHPTNGDLETAITDLNISQYLPKTEASNTYATKTSVSTLQTTLETAIGKKADSATTLSGYGITDAFTKSQSNNNYIGWERGAFDVDTLYDAGLYMVASGTNVPFGSAYAEVMTLPYRQLKGNKTPDFGAQLAFPNGDDATKPNSMFFRTSLKETWNQWQEVATVDFVNTLLTDNATQTWVDNKLNGYATIDSVTGIKNTLTGQIGAVSADLTTLQTTVSNQAVTILANETGLGELRTTVGDLNETVGNLSKSIPTNNNQLTNGAGYITSAALPTTLPASDVYAWAKAETKPTYTAAEVGALAVGGTAVNSDKLNGLSKSDFVRSYGDVGANYSKGNWLGYSNVTEAHGGSTVGGVISAGNEGWGFQLNGGAFNDGVYYRAYSDGTFNTWRKIAFTDSNVASATKLQTARTLWGQSFDGTANISLGLTIDGYKTAGTVSRISDLGDKGLVVSTDDKRENWGMAFWTEGNGNGYIQQQAFSAATTYPLCLQPFGGNVGIGTKAPSEKLEINGNVKASGIVTANAFYKSGSSDSYVLLGGGGHKAISDFLTTQDHYKNSVTNTNGTAQSPVHGGSFTIPNISVNTNGHITNLGTTTINLPSIPSSLPSNGIINAYSIYETSSAISISQAIRFDTLMGGSILGSDKSTGYNNAVLSISRFSNDQYTTQLGFSGKGIYARIFSGKTPDTLTLWKTIIMDDGAGNVGIGTDKPSEKLEVNGNIKTNAITIGGVTLSWDSVNNALVVNGNMYGTGSITAKKSS